MERAASQAEPRSSTGPQVALLAIVLVAFAWLLNALATPPWFLASVVDAASRTAWIVVTLGVAGGAVLVQLLALRGPGRIVHSPGATADWQVSPVGDQLELLCPKCKVKFTLAASAADHLAVCPNCGRTGHVGKIP